MKRVQGGPSARVTGSLAKGAACSFPTPLSEAVARFDNAPFQIRRKPSKAGALGRRGLLRALGRIRACKIECYGLGVVFAASRSGEPRCKAVYSAAPITPPSPWSRSTGILDTTSEKPDPEPIENRASGPQPCRESSRPPAAIDKSQTIAQW